MHISSWAATRRWIPDIDSGLDREETTAMTNRETTAELAETDGVAESRTLFHSDNDSETTLWASKVRQRREEQQQQIGEKRQPVLPFLGDRWRGQRRPTSGSCYVVGAVFLGDAMAAANGEK